MGMGLMTGTKKKERNEKRKKGKKKETDAGGYTCGRVRWQSVRAS
jgi:hypothetical protein